MAREARIREEEVAQAKQLRDSAKSVADFRKALSVILAAELGLDADRTADILGTSRRPVFRHRALHHLLHCPARRRGTSTGSPAFDLWVRLARCCIPLPSPPSCWGDYRFVNR